MMNCNACQENLTAWLDGELKAGIGARVRTHLEGCARCQDVLKQHRRERLWLEKHQTVLNPSPELWQRIEGDIRSQSVPLPLWGRLLNLVHSHPAWRYQKAWAGAALTVLIAISGFFAFQQILAPSPEHSVRQMMEQYIQLRENQEQAHRPSVVPPASNVDELKSANPFLDETLPRPERNPFEI